MTGPVRIQRRRIAGWRAPAGAVYVGRGTRWGNPWVVAQTQRGWAVWTGTPVPDWAASTNDEGAARLMAVGLYREYLDAHHGTQQPGEPASAEPCGPDGCAHPDQHAPCPAATPDGPDRWQLGGTGYRSSELDGETGDDR